jgi:hypothetical protein
LAVSKAQGFPGILQNYNAHVHNLFKSAEVTKVIDNAVDIRHGKTKKTSLDSRL